ncbi:hypothetical protein GQX73_g5918 [Xylaria multiplex]|uniref:Protein kinase domain-containing protein n=1 Tax=Xylaria multiplex TaxID=323545 RepID=A0A7C8IR52_9PEZI|nr:hypothetical protein GQX73_g5918 [Xylaria multiplex]
MSGIESNECPIFKSVKRCYDLFEILLEILQTRVANEVNSRGNVPGSRELILDYKRRLQLWAGSVGANADPLVGLGTRLRSKQKLQALIIQLLQLVETNLKRIIDFESPRQRLKPLFYILKRRSRPPNLSPASGAALDAIQGGIERLDHLALAARQSSDTEPILHHRVESSSTEDEDVLFERTMNLFVGGLLLEIPGSLKAQLVASLVSRRRRILDQRRRQGEPFTQQQIPEEPSLGITSNLSAASSNDIPTLSESFGGFSITSSSTELYLQPFQPHEGTRICTWCSESLQDFNLNSPGRWNHIYAYQKNVHPLAIILGRFKNGGNIWKAITLVNGRKTFTQLPAFFCDLCGSEFTHRRDLGQHIGSAHPNQFTSQELASMVERNVITRSRDYGVCLLCNVNIFLHPEGNKAVLRGKLDSNSNTSDEEHVSSQLKSAADPCMSTPQQSLDTITRHIATHLKSLALLSIRNIEDNTPTMGSGDSEKAAFDSLDNVVKHQGGTTGNLLLPQTGDENPRYTNPVLKAFRESIVKAYVESATDHQDFLPQDSFQSLITPETVQRVIESSARDDSITQTLVEFVMMKARKLFVILAVTGMEIIPALISLQQYDFTDDYLPISRDIDLDNCKINNADRKCNHPPALNAFHHSPWDMVMLRMFYNEQWKFLAPVFSHDRRTQKLQLKCILPFIKPPFSHEPRKSSFFSDVYQKNRKNTLLAIKELRPTSEMPDGFGPVNLFDQEVLILEKLADFDHNHLVTLSGSFSRGDRHYILFPWANGGNLREFWMKDPRPLNREFMLEVLQQLTGLMHALCLMHKEKFRHGDLKPENILIFLEDEHKGGIGTLKISDMGQARHHQYQTSCRSQPTQTRIGTMTYEAPEAVVSTNRPRSRLYDVWSMGCVFFEFIVWLLDGPAGLEGLARDTQDATGQATFFNIKPGDQGGWQADLHSAVHRRLENFMRHEVWTVDTSLGDLVRVVSNQMLVIPLPQGSSFDKDPASLASSLPAEPVAELSVSPEASLIFNLAPATSSSLPTAYIKQRADACTIKRSLEQIYGRAREDSTYLLPSDIISTERGDDADTKYGHLLMLPRELHLHIVEQLDSICDVSSVVQLNRYFHALLFDYLFDLTFTKRLQKAQGIFGRRDWETGEQKARYGSQQTGNVGDLHRRIEFQLTGSLFQCAVRIDSLWMIEYIATRRKVLDLMGPLPRGVCARVGYSMETGYLHFALVADAPRVAAYLLKCGVDMSRDISDHPELTPLCLTLSMKPTNTQKELDASLRIACSYVLPQTVRSLLVRGANPNAYSPYGLNAIHWLLAARLPGLSNDSVYQFSFKSSDPSWKSRIPTILNDLLAFGSDIHSSTQTLSRHECHPACWKSIDCSHKGETAVHLATVSKIPEILPLLMENGADLQALDGDGYTPLYGALRQEHDDAVDMILRLSFDENPIVHVPRRSTALHIACRFAYTRVVDQLLSAGVSANVVDSQGYTPLHEVLKQSQLGREKDVLDTLRSLSEYGADPDIPTSVPTPRTSAKSHYLPAVREMFEFDPPERPARLHMRKTVGSTDRPAKIQADPTPKSRVWKNPKSLVGTSVNSKARKEVPKPAPRDIQVTRALTDVSTETDPAQEEETCPPTASTPPKSVWFSEDTSKKITLPPPSQNNKQYRKDAERPREPRESFPALIEENGTLFAGEGYDSTAASFWGGLHRPAAVESHSNDKPERKKPKRGRAQWKPLEL